MATSTNCSYSDSNGDHVQQFCSSTQTYCCDSGDTKTCSTTACTASTDSGFDFTVIAFWSVLGGLLVICLVGLALLYVICYLRKPRGCLSQDPMDELLEETIHEEEVHTVTSETRDPNTSGPRPTVVCKTEKRHTITTRQRSRGNSFQNGCVEPPVTIRITCQTSDLDVEHPGNRGRKNTGDIDPGGTGSIQRCSISPRSPRSTRSGLSPMAPIA